MNPFKTAFIREYERRVGLPFREVADIFTDEYLKACAEAGETPADVVTRHIEKYDLTDLDEALPRRPYGGTRW
jgi:hypothetical protein